MHTCGFSSIILHTSIYLFHVICNLICCVKDQYRYNSYLVFQGQSQNLFIVKVKTYFIGIFGVFVVMFVINMYVIIYFSINFNVLLNIQEI